ncbi:autotransporter assembly complex family protein [Oceanicella sp. SM1341]|uniref:autotransporter assembly complex protein TamA n=1 Tax=Oceanicella sp. SM1341 TaxID=1548889 RepID=UPI0013004F63|nr:BamA/TamA family outer membrane protein [Oceanicella sp. SM1341]
MDRNVLGRGLLLCALSGLASGCSDELSLAEASPPETQIEGYEIVLDGAPDEAFSDLAEEALQVYRLEENGAQSRAFLRRRAEGDIETLVKMLKSQGYYEGTASIELSPPEAEEVTVTLHVIPGPRYELAAHDFQLVEVEDTPPPLDAKALGSPVGGPAVAQDIVTAEDAAVGELQRRGFAYARFLGRDAVADPAAHTIEVQSSFQVGRHYTFGDVTFDNITVVEDEYLRTYINWEPGETFSQAKLRDYQRELSDTGLFTAVSADTPENAPKSRALPITVSGEPRPPRTVSAGLYYDTTDGVLVKGSLAHRNLFGRNEQGSVALEAGLDTQRLQFSYLEPQFKRDGQSLVGGLELRNEDIDAYEEQGGTLTLGIERELSDVWTVGAGGLVEVSRIKDEGETSDAFLGGIPVFVRYDDTDDLLDPREGIRFRVSATPFGGEYNDEGTTFLTLDGNASTYVPLDEERKYVLALRGRLASILAENLDRVPPTRRLYAGGGGSIRGYGTDMVGPLDDDGDPVGGLSAMEVGAEMRAQVWGDIGVVAFLEAGSVSPESYPDFDDGVQTAAGIGGRYYSPVGPIRFDIGVPLNPRDDDDDFQLYFSIGQAF